MSTLLVLAQTSFSWSMDALGVIDLDAAAESDKAVLDRHYEYFKDKPGKDLIESIARFHVLHPIDSAQTLFPRQGDWIPSTDGHVFSARPGISVQSYLAEALKEITNVSFRPCSLQICILTPNTNLIQKSLTFHHKSIELIRQSLHQMYLAPARAVALNIALCWSIARPMIPVHQAQSLIHLPSRERHNHSSFFSNASEQAFELNWQRGLLQYRDDLHIYVWQPHLQRRPANYISTTVIVPTVTEDRSSHRRLVLLVQPPSLLGQFSDSGWRTAWSSAEVSHSWNATHELFAVLVGLYNMMIGDCLGFVNDMKSKIKETVFAGRQIPTRSKIQYLLHVDDCRQRAINDIVASEAVLAQIKDATESVEFCCQSQHDKKQATKTISWLLPLATRQNQT